MTRGGKTLFSTEGLPVLHSDTSPCIKVLRDFKMYFVYLFIRLKVTGTVQVRSISVRRQEADDTQGTLKRMRHLKARRCRTQRLKRDNNVLQLAGAHKTLKSGTMQDFLGNKICGREPKHEAAQRRRTRNMPDT